MAYRDVLGACCSGIPSTLAASQYSSETKNEEEWVYRLPALLLRIP